MKYYCECGCGLEVNVYRGKPRRFIQGHSAKIEKNRKMHSERMKGNKLFKGRKMPDSAKEKISKSQMGKNNSVWKGGRTISGGGYVSIHKPDHPFADVNGRVKEERLVVEKHLKRFLRPNEVVHHINCVKTDNRIENLKVMTISEHNKFHALKRWKDAKKCSNKKLPIASRFNN